MGYYIGRDGWGPWVRRFRRFLFVSCSFGVSFRIFFTEFGSAFAGFVVVCLVIAVIPDFWSVHLPDEQKPYLIYNSQLQEYLEHEGTFRRNTTKKEFQLLAHFMKERLCLVLQLRTIISKLYDDRIGITSPIIRGILVISRGLWNSGVLVCTYFIPVFYFYVQILMAMTTAINTEIDVFFDELLPDLRSFLKFLATVCNCLLVVYLMVSMMFVCYAFVELTMFTYGAAVLFPSMVFRYVSLIGAPFLILRKLTNDMKESYDNLRDQMVKSLKDENCFKNLRQLLNNTLKKTRGKVSLTTPDRSMVLLLYYDHYGTYLSRPLFDYCKGECEPLPRKVVFMVVKMALVIIYVIIAFFVLQGCHQENEVSALVSMMQTVTMSFIPNLFQYLVERSHFSKEDFARHRNVEEAIITFVRKVLATGAVPLPQW
jgi:hypothetical protein